MGLLCPAPRPIACPLGPGLVVEEQTLTFQRPKTGLHQSSCPCPNRGPPYPRDTPFPE